jgi:hypothetical protein
MVDVTNLFPNPDATTLNGSRPKHFLPGNSLPVITQTVVDGDAKAVNTGSGGLNMKLGEAPSTGNSLAMVDGTDYIMSVLVSSPTGEEPTGDAWGYLYSGGAGESEHSLLGPGPWRIWGGFRGVYDSAIGLTCWGFDDPVHIDKVMLHQGTIYREYDWDYTNVIPTNTTVDAYAIGLRPGKSYVFAGYAQNTFTIKSGPDSGSLTNRAVWVQPQPSTWAGGAFDGIVAIPEGHEVIQFVTTGTGHANWGIYDYIPYFDGDTPDADGYTYSWVGTADDSASIRSEATGATVPEAKVFVGGTLVPVTSMRIVVDGTLTIITEAGN